ncbi:MAG: alkylresorcinol/alkylpyrone synthase, partial [Pseudonocardiales bacterium]|nr:alkylresorcinol/alkylpyrone synthase [Pseudonocardiales bacterium]
MTTIAGVRGVLPEHRNSQQAITDAIADWCLSSDRERALLRRFHQNAQVRTRHTAVPLERYRELTDFGASNDVFIEQGTALGARAVTEALAAAGLGAADVDLILFTTVTGVVVPSLDVLIAPIVGLRPDVKRIPLFGLGCVAGAAGI